MRRWRTSSKRLLKEPGCTEVGELLAPKEQQETPVGCETQGPPTDTLFSTALANGEPSRCDSGNRVLSSKAVPILSNKTCQGPF